jgi:hypothetical protein
MEPQLALQATLNEARHPHAVMEAVLRAVDGMPSDQLDTLPVNFRPRRLTSRDDVEHWARRLETAPAMGLSARPMMRDFFARALSRLDEIGPARGRWR